MLAFADIRDIDPRLLVIAVSMMHLDTTHNVARSRLTREDNLYQLHGKIAPLAGKIRAVQDRAIQAELQATQSQIGDVTQLNSRYVDNLTVSEADNERFQSLEQWAADRGISLEASTKAIKETIKETVEVEIEVEMEVEVEDTSDETEPPETEDLEESVQAECEEPKAEEQDVGDEKRKETRTITKTVTEVIEKEVTRLVADHEAIQRNQQKLEDYLGQVEAGTADNQAVRQAIAEDSQIAAVRETLEELKHSLALESVGDLDSAIENLGSWANAIVSQIEHHLVTARAVHDQVERLTAQLTEHRKDIEEMYDEEHTRDLDQRDFARRVESFLKNQEQAAPELLETLRKAVESTQKYIDDMRSRQETRQKEQMEQDVKPANI
jgi:hypothetical protein